MHAYAYRRHYQLNRLVHLASARFSERHGEVNPALFTLAGASTRDPIEKCMAIQNTMGPVHRPAAYAFRIALAPCEHPQFAPGSLCTCHY